MQLHLYRHLWGVTQPWSECIPAFAREGYAGIETGLPAPEREAEFKQLLAAHGLAYIPQVFTAGKSVTEHLTSFRQLVERAATFKPTLVNCHSGSDAFMLEEALEFYREAVKIADDAGVRVAHETHRGRVFYNPWCTRDIIESVEGLELCCDYSHWVCVCERLLQGCEAILKLTAERALHVHARVGYEEGPQVPDPSAPEYARHLEAHEAWWDQVWASQKRRGFKVTTLTPEFGPPNYLHTLPHTNVPVADLARVCAWQAKRQRERFEAGVTAPSPR